jgi:5-methyltetrahydrofolate--homocysteine methyltransferase
MGDEMTIYQTIAQALSECNQEKVEQSVTQALANGCQAKAILDEGLMSGMEIIGGLMEREEILIPEVIGAAEIMADIIEKRLKSNLMDEDMNPYGKAVFATVRGDIHDIGKNLVIMMLESAGFELIDLGVDVAEDRIVDAVKEHNPKLLCLSALLTTTMPMIETTIQATVKSGIRDQVKILIGGAPLDEAFAREVGADGYALDASSAIKVAKDLVMASGTD